MLLFSEIPIKSNKDVHHEVPAVADPFIQRKSRSSKSASRLSILFDLS